MKDLRERRLTGKKMDTAAFKRFLADQEAFLSHTRIEMVDEKDVIPGMIQEMKIPEVKAPRSAKRARVEQ